MVIFPFCAAIIYPPQFMYFIILMLSIPKNKLDKEQRHIQTLSVPIYSISYAAAADI